MKTVPIKIFKKEKKKPDPANPVFVVCGIKGHSSFLRAECGFSLIPALLFI